jgi:hypothetical protein
MALPRRQIIRLAPGTGAVSPDRQQRLQQLRTRLEHERRLLGRWMARLRRAFHAVEKAQGRINRIERTVAHPEK